MRVCSLPCDTHLVCARLLYPSSFPSFSLRPLVLCLHLCRSHSTADIQASVLAKLASDVRAQSSATHSQRVYVYGVRGTGRRRSAREDKIIGEAGQVKAGLRLRIFLLSLRKRIKDADTSSGSKTSRLSKACRPQITMRQPGNSRIRTHSHTRVLTNIDAYRQW